MAVIGRTVAHYKILEEIGAGGMGIVFKAEDTRLKRIVALKFLPPQLTQDPVARQRLLHEAHAASSLQHDNICTIHEIGETDDGGLFICMDYYEGEPLKNRIAHGPLDVETAIDIVSGIARGLEEAHRRGIVHRDIKPANIVLPSNGGVKILDFGLAKVADQTKLTKSGSTVGTVAYMSPEQVRGEDVDRRSDLFSLGVVFYELLTGVSPFAAEYEAAVSHKILNSAPPPLRNSGVKLASQIEPVVGKMLAKDSSERYTSAKDVIAALGAIKGADSLPQPKRRRRSVLVAAAIGVVATLLAAWWMLSGRDSNVQASEPRLAILYFENVTQRDDPERLGEVTTNLLITDLSESKYVSIVSSQRLYDILKNIGKENVKVIDRDTATEVARRAGADRMLVGSIMRMGESVELTSQLIEVASGQARASQRIRGASGDNIFDLVDRLSAEVKRDLGLPLGANTERDVSVADITTHSPEAYRNYLEGMDHMNQYNFIKARASLERAVAADSTFALAWLALSHQFLENADLSTSERRAALDKAVRYSGEISESEARYLDACRKALNNDVAGAVSAIEELRRLQPDNKLFHWKLAELLIPNAGAGSVKRRIDCLNQVIALDPRDKLAYNELAYNYYALGQKQNYTQAIDYYVRLAPHDANVHDTRADLYGYEGDIENARRSYQAAIEIDSTFASSWGKLGRSYLKMGNEASARRCWKKASSLGGISRTFAQYDAAVLPLYRGRGAEAMVLLKQGLDEMSASGVDNWFVRCQMLYVAYLRSKLGDPSYSEAEVARAFNGYATNAQLNKCAVLLFGELGSTHLDEYLQRIRESIGPVSLSYAITKTWIEMNAGRYPNAVAMIDSIRSSQDQFVLTYTQGLAYLRVERWSEAVAKLERCRDMLDAPGTPLPHLYVRTHVYLAQAYEGTGEFQKAIHEYETFIGAWQDADAAFSGEVADARARLAKLRTAPRKT